ncbi:hypothetical protein MPDQ_004732 [Monascus purpureus]|uniref:Fatty acid hydroxylase domain-containing protein n=1 Tax=Monascus purpureus TaxID=5098 RepID=A0A507QGX9_MONPU|nr:hypothetical protein MPDQ_004732 [Monascus purpureus]
MFRSFWFRAFEVWLVGKLLSSPTFHRMVGRVHQKVHHLKYGVPPEEMGGTKLDNNGRGLQRFLEYFKEEIKDQMKGKPPNKS